MHFDIPECPNCGADLEEGMYYCNARCEQAYKRDYFTRLAQSFGERINRHVPGFYSKEKGLQHPYKAALKTVLFSRRARKVKRLKYSYRLYTGLLNKGVQPYRAEYHYTYEIGLIVDAMAKEWPREKIEFGRDKAQRYKLEQPYYEFPLLTFGCLKRNAGVLIYGISYL